VTNECSSTAVTVTTFLFESWLCTRLCKQHFVNSIDFGILRIVIAHEKAQTLHMMTSLKLAIGSL